MEDAVYKLAGYPARRFGLVNRGEIREGNYADVVVFDAENVTDHATFEEPRQLSTGIEHVLVNGVPIIANGIAVEDLPDRLPGRYLKFHRDE